MNAVDFLIGLTLMNAMPHFVLGIWKGRMFSAFGFGDARNLLYGALNFVASVSLFIARYGPDHLLKNGIYAGGEFLLPIYFITGRLWYSLFRLKQDEKARHATGQSGQAG